MFKKILLIFFGIILGLSILSGIDRYAEYALFGHGYFKAFPPNHTAIYDNYEYTMTAKTSSLGIRGKEISVQKPKNTYRILAIGDSFTFGEGVDENQAWVRLLEKDLHIPGKKVQMVNAGMPGAWLPEEITVCQAYRKYLNVDAVVVGLYGGDDLQQEVIFQLLEDNKTIWEKLYPTLVQAHNPIISLGFTTNPPPVQVISQQWSNVAKSNPEIANSLDPRIKKELLNGRINPWLLASVYASGDDQFYLHVLNKTYLSNALALYKQSLLQLKNKCTQNLPTAIIFLPSADQVTDKYYPIRHEFGYSTDKHLTTFDFDKVLRPIISKYGFGYISTLSALRKKGCQGCYYSIDIHLTKEGNKKVEEAILYPLQKYLSSKNMSSNP